MADDGQALPAVSGSDLRRSALAMGTSRLEPRSMGELIEFAQLFAKAGPMIGKPFRDNPGACAGIIQRAMLWRMDPYAVSQKAYVTNDAIAYEAQLVNAVIIANGPLDGRPRYTFSGQGDNRVCTVTARLKGEVEPVDYTTPELAKIRKNSPLWKDDPDQQLTYYAVRALARRYFPDVILGVYTVEEMQDVKVVDDYDPAGPKRISSAAAKREGTWDVILAEIKQCRTVSDLCDWRDAWENPLPDGTPARNTTVPRSWVDPIDNEILRRMEDLSAAEAVQAPAEAGAEEQPDLLEGA